MLSPAALSLHNKLCFCKEILDFGLSFTRLALAVTIHGGKTGAGFTATKKNGAKDIDLLNSYWSFLGFLHKSDINTNSHLNLFFSFFCLNLTHTHTENWYAVWGFVLFLIMIHWEIQVNPFERGSAPHRWRHPWYHCQWGAKHMVTPVDRDFIALSSFIPSFCMIFIPLKQCRWCWVRVSGWMLYMWILEVSSHEATTKNTFHFF